MKNSAHSARLAHIGNPTVVAHRAAAASRQKIRALFSKTLVLTAAFLLLAAAHLRAGSATWLQNPVDSNWNNPGNWTAGGPPNGPMDTATLGTSTNGTVSLSADTEANTILCNGTNNYYVLASPGLILTVSGAGITDSDPLRAHLVFTTEVNGAGDFGLISFFNSAVVEGGVYFSNSGATVNAIGAFGGVTRFADSSNAGSGTFTNQGGEAFGAFGGSTVFFGDAKAGSGIFINLSPEPGAVGGSTIFNGGSSAEDGTFTNNPGGLTQFNNTSRAGSASFTNRGGSYNSAASGGITEFTGTAGAASGTFNNNGSAQPGTGGGHTRFTNMSGANSARLIANSGTGSGEGGAIVFDHDSTGGTARVELFGTGNLDIRPHNAPGVTIGSIQGDGLVALGGRKLTVGSNNLSTSFSGSIVVGSSATGGSLSKIGTGTLILSGANVFAGGTTITAGRILANNSTGSALGSGPVTITNSGTALGGTGRVSGPVTVNAGAILSGGNAKAASGSLKLANNVVLNSGAIIELGLGKSGAHSTLSRTGGTWTFASNQAFTFVNLSAQPGTYDNIITGLAGNPGGTASWTIKTPGFVGTFAYDGAGNIDLTLSATPGFVANLSTRLPVGTGENVLIEGFIVQGPAGSTKKIIVRAIGPSLAAFGVPDALANPTLEIRNASNAIVARNNDWKKTQVGGLITSDQSAAISASGLAPSNDLESAIIANLAPGSYTAVVRGLNNATGTGVVDAFDLSPASAAKLANFATRGLIQPGDKLMIAGFIVQNGPLRTVVRAIGPSLTAFGIANALPDTTLQLRNQNGVIVRENDDWQSDPAQKQQLENANLQPSHNLEAALIQTIQPGQYTAQVRGKGQASGIGVVQIYFLQ